MRIIFFGTPKFAVPTLAKLLSEPEFQVLGVVTQPDTRRGRGNQMSASPVKELALKHNLEVWTPDRIKKDTPTLEALAALGADVFVVVAYGQILSQAILDMPKSGCINVHGSLLPQYRGAAPIQWALANGETMAGITTMQMDAGIDTGAMLLKASIPIDPGDHVDSLSAKLADLGANLLVETLRQLNGITPEPQNHAESTYAPMISKEDWQLDWQKSAIALHNQIRGFYPNCYTSLHDQRLKVLATEVMPASDRSADVPSGAASGTLVELRKNVGFAVQTSDGLLLMKEVQPAGKRSQTGWDFANGSRLQVGEVLI
jgi:methionyl-tRNA formyltransferase